MAENTSWSGSVWGYSTGSLELELQQAEDRVQGKFAVIEPGLGRLVGTLAGVWKNGTISAELSGFQGQYSLPVELPKAGRIEAALGKDDGVLRGEWKTDAGTNGNFLAVKVAHTLTLANVEAKPSHSAEILPPQSSGEPHVPPLMTRTISLSSYRLDLDSVRRLCKLMTENTAVQLPAINAMDAGREFIHIGIDNLVNDPYVPALVYSMIIAANENAQQIGTKNVSLSLKKSEPNILFVSGYDRVWVEGKAAQIESFLRNHESKSANMLRRYGSNLNSLIFLGLLAFLPSIESLRHRELTGILYQVVC